MTSDVKKFAQVVVKYAVNNSENDIESLLVQPKVCTQVAEGLTSDI